MFTVRLENIKIYNTHLGENKNTLLFYTRF